MNVKLLAAILLLIPAPVAAHRLDEYLQATLISIEKDRMQVEIHLTPGVAVFPVVIAAIGGGAEGAVSQTAQKIYAGRVLRDLSFRIDGQPLFPQLVSTQFPKIVEMQAGTGAIRMVLRADLPSGGSTRRLVFENRHLSGIGAYLVNCLVPADPGIRILAQRRNYSQSRYELEYSQPSAGSAAMLSGLWADGRAWLGMLALVFLLRFVYQRRQVAPGSE